jgi:hypothetical protein
MIQPSVAREGNCMEPEGREAKPIRKAREPAAAPEADQRRPIVRPYVRAVGADNQQLQTARPLRREPVGVPVAAPEADQRRPIVRPYVGAVEADNQQLQTAEAPEIDGFPIEDQPGQDTYD